MRQAPKPSFIFSEREAIGRALKITVSDLKRDVEDILESDREEPSIDVRLCIDSDGWIIRTGDSSFDPYHSAVCAASCVTADTESEELLEDLIQQALDQSAEQGEEN